MAGVLPVMAQFPHRSGRSGLTQGLHISAAAFAQWPSTPSPLRHRYEVTQPGNGTGKGVDG